MPYDPNAWKREALAHYLALAQLPVPGAVATAKALASAAEQRSAGGLDGLRAALDLEIPDPTPAAPPRNATNRRS